MEKKAETEKTYEGERIVGRPDHVGVWFEQDLNMWFIGVFDRYRKPIITIPKKGSTWYSKRELIEHVPKRKVKSLAKSISEQLEIPIKAQIYYRI